jgi:hypothetical protein
MLVSATDLPIPEQEKTTIMLAILQSCAAKMFSQFYGLCFENSQLLEIRKDVFPLVILIPIERKESTRRLEAAVRTF